MDGGRLWLWPSSLHEALGSYLINETLRGVFCRGRGGRARAYCSLYSLVTLSHKSDLGGRLVRAPRARAGILLLINQPNFPPRVWELMVGLIKNISYFWELWLEEASCFQDSESLSQYSVWSHAFRFLGLQPSRTKFAALSRRSKTPVGRPIQVPKQARPVLWNLRFP